MESKLPDFLLRPAPCSPEPRSGRVSGQSYFDKSIARFAFLIKTTCFQENSTRRNGFFQRLDARVKMLFLLLFVLIISVKRSLPAEAGIGMYLLLIVGLSRIPLLPFYRRVFLLTFLFGFLAAMPACLNVITPGKVIQPLMQFSGEHCFRIWCIPETLGITRQGLEGVALLTLRVFNSLSLTFLVISTTPFPEMDRALKSLKMPDTLLMIVALSYQYVFIFAKTVEELYLARKSKLIEEDAGKTRNWLFGRMAFLFRKTQSRCEEVFGAMQARGFSDGVKLCALQAMTNADRAWAAVLLFSGVLFMML